MPNVDRPASYIIRIQGHIDASLVDCGPVEIRSAVADGAPAVTRLSGIVTDQAGLLGLMRHLHGLGIVVLSVERLAWQTDLG
jgi:hypothetical protein